MSDALLEELLAKPVGPVVAQREKPDGFTSEIVLGTNTVEVEIRDEDGTVNEGTAAKYLAEEGLSIDDWEVTHFRKIKYGQNMESVRFSYKRVSASAVDRADEITEVIDSIKDYRPNYSFDRTVDGLGFVVLIGDMQFGKMDGDGPAGTVARTVEAINLAADAYSKVLSGVSHVHIAWLGDHIEGFVSQGGANIWRTPLTLSEQIRLTRRVMIHALKTFAPLSTRLTMAAVPGNHGESVRFSGKGITRYDDSHDTESLIAVKDAVDLAGGGQFDHCEFFVPDTDELTVTIDVAGTRFAHAHGHQWRPGKAIEWWRGQAFNPDSNLRDADVLVAGHLHHEHVIADGRRLFVQVPALESESTWWRHSNGSGGRPGIITGLTKDGAFDKRETIRV